jgi:hypothetical protein
MQFSDGITSEQNITFRNVTSMAEYKFIILKNFFGALSLSSLLNFIRTFNSLNIKINKKYDYQQNIYPFPLI